MTMGLVRGMTTLNTKKHKRKKLSQNQIEKLKVDLRDYNKRMKQNHAHNLCMTLDEYIDYVQGYFKPRQTHQYTQTFRPTPEPKVRETKPVSTITLPTPKNNVPANGSSKRTWKEQQERLEISKQYSIVPAYNKGPYMVVSKDELKTAGKKV